MNETLAGLRPEQRDALRLLGVTFFATGALALFIRKASQDQWAAFPKLLILAIPCVLLYGLGTGLIRVGRTEDRPVDEHAVAPWRAAALVFGLVLIPLMLFQLDRHARWRPRQVRAQRVGLCGDCGRGRVCGADPRTAVGRAVRRTRSDHQLDRVLGRRRRTRRPPRIRWLLLIIAAVLVAGAPCRSTATAARAGPEFVTAAGVAAPHRRDHRSAHPPFAVPRQRGLGGASAARLT